jgi:hypothetical protein
MAAYVQSGSQSQAEGVAARIEVLNGALEDPEGPFGDYNISGNRRERG